MNRFFYVTKELFKLEPTLLTLMLILVLLGIFTITVINFIIILIIKSKDKKKPFGERNLIQKLLHPNFITTLSSIFLFIIVVLIGTYIYTKHWELEHKKFTLDTLKYSELKTLGYTSSYIDSYINTKIVETHKINNIEIEFYSTPERSFNEHEISVIKNIFKELPKEFTQKLPKKIKVYSYKDYSGISAMAIGNQIYLSNNTFQWSYPTLKLIIIHELTHSLQYNSISPEMIEKKLIKGKSVELTEDSDILEKYIKTAGWEKTDNEEGYIIDTKIDHHLTTDYGKYAGPVEDMADSTALFLIGQEDWLSESRQKWIEEFFGKAPYKIYDLGYLKGYKYITAVPEISNDLYYYPLNEHSKSDLAKFTYRVEEDFYQDFKQDKDLEGDKFMLIHEAFLQNEKPDDWNKEVEKWVNKMEELGWKLKDKSTDNKKNKIKTAKLVFTAPNHKIVLDLEDRRSYTNQAKISQLEKDKAYYEKFELDTSYEDGVIENYKETKEKIREEGIFISAKHGINLN